TVAIYLLTPLLRIRFRGLSRVDGQGSARLSAYLAELVDTAGMRKPPIFWVDPADRAVRGVGFGRCGSGHIQLSAGLVERWAGDRPGDRQVVAAVVLHELAHVRNRDIGYTYLTMATWRAFVAVALAPYLVVKVVGLAVTLRQHGWAALSVGPAARITL